MIPVKFQCICKASGGGTASVTRGRNKYFFELLSVTNVSLSTAPAVKTDELMSGNPAQVLR